MEKPEFESFDVGALDDAIKYHEMLIHMTEKRGGRPCVYEKFTLRALKYLKGMIDSGR